MQICLCQRVNFPFQAVDTHPGPRARMEVVVSVDHNRSPDCDLGIDI